MCCNQGGLLGPWPHQGVGVSWANHRGATIRNINDSSDPRVEGGVWWHVHVLLPPLRPPMPDPTPTSWLGGHGNRCHPLFVDTPTGASRLFIAPVPN